MHGEILIRSINQKLGNFHHTRRPVARHPTPSPSTASPASSASGPSGITEVTCYPPCSPILFRSTQHIAPRIPRGFLIGAIRTTPTGCPSHQLLAPEWQSVEYFAQRYYLPMAWPVCSPVGPGKAGREATGDYPGCRLYSRKRTLAGTRIIKPDVPIRPDGLHCV